MFSRFLKFSLLLFASLHGELHLTTIPGMGSRTLLCCHGYGGNYQIIEEIKRFSLTDATLIGFNFPDPEKNAYGTREELLPVLEALENALDANGLDAIDLYGFSAGGGAVINLISTLHSQKKMRLLHAIQKGIILLDSPLKSIEEISDFRGSTDELEILAKNYRENHMRPIDAVESWEGLSLHVILYFEQDDAVLSNRDDLLFIEKLRRANRQGMTEVITGKEGGHAGVHFSLWKRYNALSLPRMKYQQVLCTYSKIKEGCVEGVKTWLHSLETERRGELLQSFLDEGVLLEAAFIKEEKDASYLVYFLRAQDVDHALAIFQKSTLAVDAFHKRCWEELTEQHAILTPVFHVEHTTNATTLQSYELGVEQYIANTATEVTGQMKEWIDTVLTGLPKQARIVEIGSGFGRDAQYIESHGFTVERTDGTQSFVQLLEKDGYSAQLFNVLTQDFTASYDLIFANAVFLHFTRSELDAVLEKSWRALAPNGILAFSVKSGEGEEWTSAKIGQPRYFCYWQKEAIRSLLESKKFSVEIHESDLFLRVIAKK